MLTADDRAAVAELAPVLRRAVELDPRGLARVRLAEQAATVLVKLPFDVLVSRTVTAAPRPVPVDVAVAAADLLGWLDGAADVPPSRDLEWRAGLPPSSGWHRIETVPDAVIRDLVRTGAVALKRAGERMPTGQPSTATADALLDSVVLTVSDDTGARAEVTLRTVSAVTRMGFLPRGGQVYVDTAGRWVRVVAQYGTVYLERPGAALRLN
jgi:hypothetical protein